MDHIWSLKSIVNVISIYPVSLSFLYNCHYSSIIILPMIFQQLNLNTAHPLNLYLFWRQFCIQIRARTAEMATYLNFCRSLRFDDKPDYSYLRQLFRNLFHRQGFTYDYIFDWNMLKIVSRLFSADWIGRNGNRAVDECNVPKHWNSIDFPNNYFLLAFLLSC